MIPMIEILPVNYQSTSKFVDAIHSLLSSKCSMKNNTKLVCDGTSWLYIHWKECSSGYRCGQGTDREISCLTAVRVISNI